MSFSSCRRRYDTLLPSSAIRNPADGRPPAHVRFKQHRYDMGYCEHTGWFVVMQDTSGSGG